MSTRGERLKQAREKAGFENATDAAKALGIPYGTYSGHENDARDYHKNADLYARRFGVSLEWLLTGRSKFQPLRSATAMDTVINTKVESVPVIGVVKAGDWQDVTDIKEKIVDEYVPALGEYPKDWQYAFTVEGESLNKRAKDGDKLVCLDIGLSGVKINDGDLVIAERLRYQGQMLERSAKRYRETARGPELWPESTDPEHQKPIPLGEDGDETRIVAKVLWILRKP